MEETQVLCRFGTPLEPLDENEIPSKKPILIEDQIVTDENGRRRFHGAFTGGFSAGFWNTVGSLEGWTPKEFKSSRDEKTNFPQQKPSDFMDDEDFGEFGIAPRRIQTTDDFSDIKKDNKKRKFPQNNSGPIPGLPVLHQLLEPSKDNIALRLLKKMGWKEGQGIGARQTLKEKRKSAIQMVKEQSTLKKYGCDIGPITKETTADSEESDLSDIEGVTFAPDDFEPYIYSPKDNCFGLGYTGLSREPVLKQHLNLFGPLELLDNNKKKLSIRGKGFGVGALEEEDEDIYHYDDLSNYDFSLEKPMDKKNKPAKQELQDLHVIEGFCSAKKCNDKTKKLFVVNIPKGFIPRNWLHRKSRFEPLDEKRAALFKEQQQIRNRGLGRHDITLEERRAILEGTNRESKSEIEEGGDKGNKKKLTYLDNIEKYKSEGKKDEILNMLASKSDNFVKIEIINESGTINRDEACIYSATVQKEHETIKNEAIKITKNLESTTSSIFKPFLADSAKQDRYEKFLSKTFKSDDEIITYLGSIQPPHMSEWERQMEKKEFEQAKRIYKPLKGIMSDRFVSETSENIEKELKIIDPDRRGKTIRTKLTWHPVSLICKRFNLAEPFVNLIKETDAPKKPKLSIFDYLEDSLNKKASFVTPTIIPKIEEICTVSSDKIDSPKRLSAKDMFSKEISSNKNSSLPDLNCTELNTSKEQKTTDTVKEFITINSKYDTNIIEYKENLKKQEKNELEKEIEKLKDKHPSEKKNLYKKIFEDSSDSEELDVGHNNCKNIASNVHSVENKEISKPMILNKAAAEINILRNDSPPRGIFAAFFKDPSKTKNDFTQEEKNFEKINEVTFDCQNKGIESRTEKESNSRKCDEKDSLNIYGPKVFVDTIKSNQSIYNISNVSVSDKPNIDDKLQKLIGKHKNKSKFTEEWVELTNESMKEKKNTKKNKGKKKKKEKSKHKNRSDSSEKSSASSDISYGARKKSKKSKKRKKYKK